MTEIGQELHAAAEELRQELVACRRDLHHYPELGWCEMRTASLIARQLTELGYEVLVGRDVCDEAGRMGVPDDETLEQEYRRAAAQGADPEFLEKVRGGFTGVIGILRCGEGPTVALRFDIDALPVPESQSEEHRPTGRDLPPAIPA